MKFINDELVILSMLFVALLLVTLFIYKKYRDRADGQDSNFISNLAASIGYSLLLVYILLLFASMFPYGVFSKLVSGEVIIGIAIAFPTIYTWYLNDKSRKENQEEKEAQRRKERLEEKQKQDERRRKMEERQYEQVEKQQKFEKDREDRIKIQYLNELRTEYTRWLEKFYKEEMAPNMIDRIHLNELIENISQFEKSNDGAFSKVADIINYSSLFGIIQKKFSKFPLEEGHKFEADEWRKLNSKILRKLKQPSQEKVMENLIKTEELSSLSNIDFEEFNDILSFGYIPLNRTFRNCKFNIEDIKNSNLINPEYDSKYIFIECVFDKEIKLEEILSKNGDRDNLKIEAYYYPDNTYKNIENYVYKKLPSDSENKGKKKNNLEKQNTKENIFENRELSDYGPINEYLYTNKAISINLSDEENKSINTKIYEKIKKEDLLENVNQENVKISKSKNFIPEMKEKNKWLWHSWNVISSDDIENEKHQFFIFAIKVEADKNDYVCLVFEREQLRELAVRKTDIKGRYYFYFAKKSLTLK